MSGNPFESAPQGEPAVPDHVEVGDPGHADHHNLLADDAVWFKSNIDGLHTALSQLAGHPALKALQDQDAYFTNRVQVLADALGLVQGIAEKARDDVSALTSRVEQLEAR